MTPSATAELTVTSFHPGPMGGGILIGRSDADRPGSPLVRVRLGAGLTARDPRAGETWRVTGTTVQDPAHGAQIEARLALPLLPTGRGVQRWMATNREIPSVGAATAARLWDALGDDLYRALREGDVAVIASHVGPRAAEDIVGAFRALIDEVDVLAVYDRYGIDPKTATAACSLWGRGAVERLQADPYAISVVEPWGKVDERALKMGLTLDDPRRQRAVVLEACSRRFSSRGRGGGGHMASSRDELLTGVRALLGKFGGQDPAAAIDRGIEGGDLVVLADGLLQSRACRLMEEQVERAIAARLSNPPAAFDDDAVVRAVRAVEAEFGFELEVEQRDAVVAATRRGFAVIDGGAGTGKSTITRAIARSADALGWPYLQMALSGRAAKRLRDATGIEALTIHRFIKGVVNGKIRPTHGLALIDEASMLGTPDLWQVLSWLPTEVSVVLVGDPAQLPPIAAGLPFPTLVASAAVPRTTLRRIHRQSGDSDIPSVADAIRQGRLPALPAFDEGQPDRPGVFLASSDNECIQARTLDTFRALVGLDSAGSSREGVRALHAARVQILGATLEGPAGVRSVSDAVEARWLAEQQKVHDWGLAVGSKILWTRNSYNHRVGMGLDPEATVDLMNGSLGIVQRSTGVGAAVLFDDADATMAEIRRSDLERVARGWAVTVHKSQGSQFERVIVPLAPSRLLDRLLVYTAVTRAVRTVVLVGDPTMLADAVAAQPRVQQRRQALDIDRAILEARDPLVPKVALRNVKIDTSERGANEP